MPCCLEVASLHNEESWHISCPLDNGNLCIREYHASSIQHWLILWSFSYTHRHTRTYPSVITKIAIQATVRIVSSDLHLATLGVHEETLRMKGIVAQRTKLLGLCHCSVFLSLMVSGSSPGGRHKGAFMLTTDKWSRNRMLFLSFLLPLVLPLFHWDLQLLVKYVSR